MDAAVAETTGIKLRHVMAGLEAGVLGAIYMIVWLMVSSRLARRSVWEIPNLFATTFYDSNAYQSQYFHGSWSGLALIMVICGVGGALWALVWREDRPPFLTLFGAIAGLAVYFVFFDLIWPHVNPVISMYAPVRQLQIGYILWGMTLARAPRYAREIAEVNGVAQDAFEIRSGEVIR